MAWASTTWGTHPAERQQAYPCDALMAEPEAELYRGITVNAAPETVFRWLCQMRAAPYSYDWIDNFGRRSPETLTPGLEQLEIGQIVMRIFELADFATGQHLTLRLRDRGAVRMFGDIVVTYQVTPLSATSCRLLVKLAVQYPRGLYGRCVRAVLPWGDLVMMRKQLMNLKRLAERQAA